MEQPILKFTWTGKWLMRTVKMALIVNGVKRYEFTYNEDFSVEVPISGDSLTIDVKQLSSKGKEYSRISHTFPVEPNANYSCELGGEFGNYSGLTLQLSQPNQPLKPSDPLHYKNGFFKIGSNFIKYINSYLFPVYGLGEACFGKGSGRLLPGVLGVLGFIISMAFSFAADDGEVIVLGIKSVELLEYEPLSFTDWIINFLFGGILSLLDLISLLLP